MEPLRDRSVLITGAASGIGRRLAHELFWREKCRLLLVDRDLPGLETVKNELDPDDPPEGPAGRRPAGPRVEVFRCDVSSSADVRALDAALGERPVDVLVNNAGIFYLGHFEKMEMEDFERVVEVNLLGAARMTRALLPRLLRSPAAFIVNVSSVAGLMGAPGMCAYAASKAGLIGFSRALAGELEGRVGVCVICPTFVKTGIADNALIAGGAPDRGFKVEAMNMLLSVVGSDARRVAKAIAGAVRERKKFVLVNPDAHALYYLERMLPAPTRFLVDKAYGKIRDMGLFE